MENITDVGEPIKAFAQAEKPTGYELLHPAINNAKIQLFSDTISSEIKNILVRGEAIPIRPEERKKPQFWESMLDWFLSQSLLKSEKNKKGYYRATPEFLELFSRAEEMKLYLVHYEKLAQNLECLLDLRGSVDTALPDILILDEEYNRFLTETLVPNSIAAFHGIKVEGGKLFDLLEKEGLPLEDNTWMKKNIAYPELLKQLVKAAIHCQVLKMNSSGRVQFTEKGKEVVKNQGGYYKLPISYYLPYQKLTPLDQGECEYDIKDICRLPNLNAIASSDMIEARMLPKIAKIMNRHPVIQKFLKKKRRKDCRVWVWKW